MLPAERTSAGENLRSLRVTHKEQVDEVVEMKVLRVLQSASSSAWLFFNFIFRCQHRRTTFPQTQAKAAASDGETYVVCLDCGKQFAYDWERMRIAEPLDPSSRPQHFLKASGGSLT
jgi:hypothetical protein